MSKNQIGRSVSRPQVAEYESDDRGASMPNFQRNYPALHEFLAKIRESDHWQKTGTMTVIWEAGFYKLVLNDRPEKRSCFVSAQGLGEAFRIAERGLVARSLAWRKQGYKTKPRPVVYK